MDLRFTPEQEMFREEVRAFLREHLSPVVADKVRLGRELTKQEHEEWHAILHRKGWLAPHWPVEFGGPGWSVIEAAIFDHERALARAPLTIPFGISMLGPVLIKYGSEQQKRHWLPRMLDGSDWWCQGYSEPGAGSDLASVRTRAVRDGDHFIVNGQKTWTTLGQHANMIFCLVRTDPSAKAQQGISFLLVDMASPGVELRPIRLLDGSHEVNEVFFTDVRVPAENLVGEESQGWTYAKYLLTYERTGIAGVGESLAAFSWLQTVVARQIENGRPLAEDPLFAARMARVEIDLDNMQTTNLRVIAAAASGSAPGAESSMIKVRGTEIRQEITSLIRRALGPAARPFLADTGGEPASGADICHASHAAAEYFNMRKMSIFGGSNEIQRNIISKTIVGL